MSLAMISDVAESVANEFFPGGKLKRDSSGQQNLDINELNTAIRNTLAIEATISERDITPFNNLGLKKQILEMAQRAYEAKSSKMGAETMHQLEKMIFLSTIDHLWKDHLLAMDGLREGVGLNAYGQKDPLIEYKKQGFRFFEMMMGMIQADVVRKIFSVQLAEQPRQPRAEQMEQAFEKEFENAGQGMQYNLSEDGNLIPIDHSVATMLRRWDEMMFVRVDRVKNIRNATEPRPSPSRHITSRQRALPEGGG
jgi:preprotein translocase subunit SecA